MIDSLILSNTNLIKNFLFLCEITAYPKWNLIYRASRDGFEAAKFHSKCDNKPNTLIVIKSTNGNIFGGYTEQSWSGSGFKTDSNAFIFSLINLDNKPKKIKWSRNQAIGCSTSHGPIFGAGHDLFISDKSNTISSSLSNLCNSYIHPEYEYKSNGAKSFLAGSYNFQVSDIEVYSN